MYLKHLKNCKALTDTTIFILWYHRDETTAKKLVKINPIREQPSSCPPFYPGELILGIHKKLAFASPHVSDTLSDSGHSPSALIPGCFQWILQFPTTKANAVAGLQAFCIKKSLNSCYLKWKKMYFWRSELFFFCFLICWVLCPGEPMCFYSITINSIVGEFVLNFPPFGYTATFRIGCL